MSDRINVFTQTVFVPAWSSQTFVEDAKKFLELAHLDPAYLERDILGVNRGRTFRAVLLEPDPKRVLTQAEVLALFRETKAVGNIAAFIAWIMKAQPKGYFASVSDDEAQLWKSPVTGNLCTPAFSTINGQRALRFDEMNGGFSDCWNFVAFRPIR